MKIESHWLTHTLCFHRVADENKEHQVIVVEPKVIPIVKDVKWYNFFFNFFSYDFKTKTHKLLMYVFNRTNKIRMNQIFGLSVTLCCILIIFPVIKNSLNDGRFDDHVMIAVIIPLVFFFALMHHILLITPASLGPCWFFY